MDAPAVEKPAVRRRLAIVTVLLFLLVGPNFGPIPTLLNRYHKYPFGVSHQQLLTDNPAFGRAYMGI
jgi:hypothetical protein